MKALIIYATKYGATETIAQTIAQHMGNADLHNMSSNDSIYINGYDCIILGSSLTAGLINSDVKRFASDNIIQLQNKKVGIFLSGLQKNDIEECFEQNFPKALLDNAAATLFAGGIFDPTKCGFFARKTIKLIAKLDSYTSTIDEEKIERFAKSLLSE